MVVVFLVVAISADVERGDPPVFFTRFGGLVILVCTVSAVVVNVVSFAQLSDYKAN